MSEGVGISTHLLRLVTQGAQRAVTVSPDERLQSLARPTAARADVGEVPLDPRMAIPSDPDTVDFYGRVAHLSGYNVVVHSVHDASERLAGC